MKKQSEILTNRAGKNTTNFNKTLEKIAVKIFTAKINDSKMWRLSRQNKSRQIIGRIFFEPEH